MTNKKFNKVLKFVSITALLVNGAAYAQQNKIETYLQPEGISRINPQYPRTMLKAGLEEDVEVNFMVDKEGKTFEVTAVNSANIEFAQASVRAIKNWTFTPASLDGEPIVGSARAIMHFEILGGTGASRKFIDAYKTFTTEGLEKTKEEMQASLVELNALGKNHYERAFFNFASSVFANKHGSTLEQMKYLEKALSYSSEQSDDFYLPKELAKSARRNLMKLQVNNQYFAEALATFKYFEDSGDKEAVEAFTPVVDRINEIGESDQSYSIPAMLDDNGSFGIKLFKHNIYIKDVEGKVAEFKLYCKKKYIGFVVEPEVSYDIPAAIGACYLQILGDANTTLQLVQR